MNVRSLCSQYNLKPSKRLGQNFLIDQNIVNKFIDYAKISAQDIILEIGPGLGALTLPLAQKAKKVIAVEIDKRLADALQEQALNYKNVEIVKGDILKIKNSKLKIKNYHAKFKMVSSLPYNIASQIIFKFLEFCPPPQSMLFMLQKEVAQRVCARPPNMSVVSVLVQAQAQAKILKYVSRNCFWPRPSVDSAIIELKPFLRQSSQDIKYFSCLVKAGFSSRRKMLKNNLTAKFKIKYSLAEKALEKAGLSSKIRAQELGVEDWRKLE